MNPGVNEAEPGLWRNRDFKLLWSGQAVSVMGTRISSLALPLLVLEVTHSAAQAGFITSARMLPYLVLGLPAGALTDRWNRKTTMVLCDVARAIALGSVPMAWALGYFSLLQLYIVALVQGSAFVFFNVAEMACLPNVISRQDLAQATSLDSAAGSAGSLLGPGIAGVIISAARTTAEGAVLAYLVDALTYLVSVLSLSFIRVAFQTEHGEGLKLSLSKQVAQGLRFLWEDRRLRVLTLTSWALSLLYAPVPLAMIVLAREHFHAPARVIGLIFGVSAVGGLIGSWVAPHLKSRVRFGFVIIGSIAIQALVTPLVGLAVSPAMMIAGWMLAFMLDPIFSMASTSYRLSVTPDEMRGRVHSIYRLGGYGAEPVGTAIGGLLLVMIGPRTEILIAAVGVGLCAIAVSMTQIRITAWPDSAVGQPLEHTHVRLEHIHSHVHDVYHQHSHAEGTASTEPHAHAHVHEPLTHSHLHSPGLHHRHGHKS